MLGANLYCKRMTLAAMQIGLPDLVNKTSFCQVKFAFHMNDYFSRSRSHIIFVTYLF